MFPRIGLLPVWGDEQTTLALLQAPLDQMLEMLRANYHPPLYYLFLKVWTRLLEWPSAAIDKIRLASVAFVLLATIAIDRLWLRDLPQRIRLCFLALWVLSPFLLLYARMGRSYTLQLLVAVIALRYATDWIREPRLSNAIRFGVAECVLLYIHYLPGLAIGGGLAVYVLFRLARGDRGRLKGLAVAGLICAILYLPWALSLVRAVRNGMDLPRYNLAQSMVVEHGVRLTYAFAAFNFGEVQPGWTILIGALVAPVIAWLLWTGITTRPVWLPIVIVGAAIAYVVTVKVVIFSLTPARMLFLLPFYLILLFARMRAASQSRSVSDCRDALDFGCRRFELLPKAGFS